MATDEVIPDEKLHFVVLPFMAQGHAIPLVDFAKLLAERRDVIVTLLLTPVNHIRVKPILGRSRDRGVRILVEELAFPAEEVGLPAGCENLDLVPSNPLLANFMAATAMLQPQVEALLQKSISPKPRCLVADSVFMFAAEVARKSGIPRILFHPITCFTYLCSHHILTSKILDTVSDEFEYFDVPGMPHKISFTRSQAKGMAEIETPGWVEFNDKVIESEKAAFGLIFNTFEDMEHTYLREYEKVRQTRIWSVGPVSLFNKEFGDKVSRGKSSTVDVDQCSKWLDAQEPGTVVYACLGSSCNLTSAQMLELGLGLEASGRSFIWVVGFGGDDEDARKSLRELFAQNGFEERVNKSGRGLVVFGWAPQVLILSHPAVGGFLTHCGWNSTLEGISAGLPAVTWPFFYDNFYNEKLLVDVLRIGVRVGVKLTVKFGKGVDSGIQVHKDDVRDAIRELMGQGHEREARRKRAKELAEKAKKAVEEGGSSHSNMGKIIEDVRKFNKDSC
uniref:Glycosyltransferase n=1 Tax=Kalanchoe fedtschenkoi TaxID=63787 RepID=A0A7N0TXF0_KALFE